MRKNIDKWNHYMSILEERAQKFIAEHEDDIPDRFYQVYPSGAMHDCEVTSVDYSFWEHGISTYFSGDKPTREQVAQLKESAESDISFKQENINLRYQYEWGEDRTASSSNRLGKVHNSEQIFITQEAAKQEQARIEAEKAEEERLLNNGHIKCTYCGDIVPEEEAVEEMMISRMYDNYKKRFTFCSGQCAAHNQMSLEG